MFLILFRNILCPQQMFPSLRSMETHHSSCVPRVCVPKKHHKQHFVRNNVSSFSRASSYNKDNLKLHVSVKIINLYLFTSLKMSFHKLKINIIDSTNNEDCFVLLYLHHHAATKTATSISSLSSCSKY